MRHLYIINYDDEEQYNKANVGEVMRADIVTYFVNGKYYLAKCRFCANGKILTQKEYDDLVVENMDFYAKERQYKSFKDVLGGKV